MNDSSPAREPQGERHRVGPVEPDLLASAVFLFAEYLEDLTAAPSPFDEDDFENRDDFEAEEGVSPEIDTRAVLDLFVEQLGTDVKMTLNLYMRVTALFRLLAGSPSLAGIALADPEGQALTDEALVAASRLDLQVERSGSEGSAYFDPREFREALEGE